MMIDKTHILEFMQTSVPKSISKKDLIRRLQIESDQRHHVKKLLRELIAGGELVEVKKNKVGLPEHLHLVIGHVQANRKGFAFVLPQKKTLPDVYVRQDDLGNAFHGDLVVVRMKRKKDGKQSEGRVVQILQRGQHRLIGTYEAYEAYGLVVPEDPRIPYKVYVEAENALRAKPAQLVVVQILRYDEFHPHPEGEIVEILGYPHTPGMDEKVVMHKYDLSSEFPPPVIECADTLTEVISEGELRQRLDLRGQQIFTIDGEKARDFDDAVSIERLENGSYKLGVHIADVSFYVREESELDHEAYRRGTSVYFPDRAIPMLPERLSNNICSLREGVDRLTLSVIMEFDPTMKLVTYNIAPSVIQSQQRFTYTLVRRILKDREPELLAHYEAFLPALELMKELSELLFQKRVRRGSLDFDLPEPELVLDLQGRVENIFKAERNLAHRMIEEFMIAANETVASHLSWMQVPSIYRTHDQPDDAKIAALQSFFGSLGLRLQRREHFHSKDIQKLLNRVRNKSIEHLVNILSLRAMKQARYAVKNTGHFGLASACYTHFTSPIRRYPDLIVHRILRTTFEGQEFSQEHLQQHEDALETIAEHSSLRERTAVDAEREIILIKKLRFMEDRVGDVFDGLISGVASFGLFIELRDYFVEGLIHITKLADDYYMYREETYSLVGERFHHTYRVGDPVRVQLANVDVGKRQIDLQLI